MTVILVGTELELNQAIATVDAATSGSFTIQLTTDITQGTDTGGTVTFGSQTLSAPPDLYALNLATGVTVTIDGAGHARDGANTYRGPFVYAGTVAIQDLTIHAEVRL
jgi:hypothetical protein